MTLELVLFDKHGKEIDWYDPVNDVSEEADELVIDHGYGEYRVKKTAYHRYELREMKESPR